MSTFFHDLDDLNKYFDEAYGPSDDEVIDDTLILPAKQRTQWNQEIANLPRDEEDVPFEKFASEDQDEQ